MSRRTILEKENVNRGRWRVGDVEDEGRTKIGMLTTNDNDYDKALWGIEGRLHGTPHP